MAESDSRYAWAAQVLCDRLPPDSDAYSTDSVLARRLGELLESIERYGGDASTSREQSQLLAQLDRLARQELGVALEALAAAAEAALALDLPLARVPAVRPPPPGSRLPYAPNPLFVGREAELRALAAALMHGTTAALTGAGGLGKTQLAVEFAHRYGAYFAGGVFWLNCAVPEGVAAEAALCGGPEYLNLRPDFNLPPDFNALKLDEQAALVRRAWREPRPRLLVFDTCEDEAVLADWRPASGGCRVLLTSRRAGWSPALGVQALPLATLPQAESVALLRHFRPDLAADDPQLAAIAAELGDLPLALHLAGSFLHTYAAADQGQPAAYLAALRRPGALAHASLLGRGAVGSPTRHDLDVARTFAQSYERLAPGEAAGALARQLLAHAAHFAPGQPIPRGLLLATAGAAAADELLAEDALGGLAGVGLIEREIEREPDGALRLHRLVAAYARGQAGGAAAQAAVEAALLAEARRLNRRGDPRPLRAWQAHLRHVTDVALARDDPSINSGQAGAAGFANELGYHLWAVGDLAGARPYFQRALEIRERALGPQHPDTALSLNNLGYLLRAQGDLAGARPYFQRALDIRERALGPQHPDTATSLNNLGYLLQAQGDLAGARPYYERALDIFERALGPEHPTTRIVRGNLAGVGG